MAQCDEGGKTRVGWRGVQNRNAEMIRFRGATSGEGKKKEKKKRKEKKSSLVSDPREGLMVATLKK